MTDHSPNTPRTHNAKGQRVNEPAQCIYDLQAWPCEVEVLRRENERLRDGNKSLLAEIDRLRDEIAALDTYREPSMCACGKSAEEHEGPR